MRQVIVGSGITGPLKGTLSATLPAKGLPTLTSKGKAAQIVKAGRYRLRIADQTAKAGFTLQQSGKKAKELTTSDFVGKHTIYVTLAPGRWSFSGGGKASPLIVIA